jgi:hypothetical protein
LFILSTNSSNPYNHLMTVHVLWTKERKVYYFPLTGIEILLTNFFYICRTWKSRENNFQKNEFLEISFFIKKNLLVTFLNCYNK